MKIIYRSLLVIFLLFILVCGGCFAYIYFNQAAVKNFFLNKINDQLASEVTIKDVDLVFFKQFPEASLELRTVKVSDPLKPKKTLLKAELIFIGFNIWDLITHNYRIRKLAIDNADLDLQRELAGKFNLTIFKTDSAVKNENMFLQLDEVKITRTRINYTDRHSNQFASGDIEHAVLSGSLIHTISELHCSANLLLHKFKNDQLSFNQDKKVQLELNTIYDDQDHSFLFYPSKIKLENLKLELSGKIQNNTDHILTDISFKSKQVSISELLSLFPVKPDFINKYTSEGEVFFNGSFKGIISAKSNAMLQMDFGISDGSLENRSNKFKLYGIHCKGKLSNGEKRNAITSFLEIKGISLKMNKGEISGNLSLRDFSNPMIDADLKGDVLLEELLQFIQVKQIKEGKGNIHFDLKLKGNAKELASEKIGTKTEISGKIGFDLQNIKGQNAGNEIKSASGSMELNQKEVQIQSLEIKTKASDISLKGKIGNLIPFILEDHQKLSAELLANSDFIDLENFILPAGSESKDEKPFQMPENVLVNVKMNGRKIVLHQFIATNSSFSMIWKDKTISFASITFQAMNGTVSGNGTIENTNDGRFLISSQLALKNLNLNELFRQCNNFGQLHITNKHVYGTLNATVDMVSVWDSKGECDFNKLYAFSDIGISNGELIGYKPLEHLSKYAKVEDLRYLKFSELKNNIEIKNRVITIPTMEMRNNALNLSVYGTHSFDNIVDYKIKIKLSEILWKKRKQKINEFNEEPDDPNHGLYLYLTMKGPADDPTFTYDKFSVKNKVKQEIKDEKQNIKEILKKELGIKKDSTIHEKMNNSEELEFEKD
ncbi:MAG: AsmA-like C-terminal region-containing protein [Bacteroidia bacterium]